MSITQLGEQESRCFNLSSAHHPNPPKRGNQIFFSISEPLRVWSQNESMRMRLDSLTFTNIIPNVKDGANSFKTIIRLKDVLNKNHSYIIRTYVVPEGNYTVDDLIAWFVEAIASETSSTPPVDSISVTTLGLTAGTSNGIIKASASELEYDTIRAKLSFSYPTQEIRVTTASEQSTAVGWIPSGFGFILDSTTEGLLKLFGGIQRYESSTSLKYTRSSVWGGHRVVGINEISSTIVYSGGETRATISSVDAKPEFLLDMSGQSSLTLTIDGLSGANYKSGIANQGSPIDALAVIPIVASFGTRQTYVPTIDQWFRLSGTLPKIIATLDNETGDLDFKNIPFELTLIVDFTYKEDVQEPEEVSANQESRQLSKHLGVSFLGEKRRRVI